MSDRYTIKDAQRAFERLCEATGHRVATAYNDIGAWALDYAPIYGGVVVEEPINEGGGVTRPLGDVRRSPREFCSAVNFALRVKEADAT